MEQINRTQIHMHAHTLPPIKHACTHPHTHTCKINLSFTKCLLSRPKCFNFSQRDRQTERAMENVNLQRVGELTSQGELQSFVAFTQVEAWLAQLAQQTERVICLYLVTEGRERGRGGEVERGRDRERQRQTEGKRKSKQQVFIS